MRFSTLHDLLRRSAQSANVISFAGGLPSRVTFPRQALAHAANDAVLAMGDEPLQYDWPEGRPGLRGLIAERLRVRGGNVTADDIVITNGAQDALSLILDVIGADEIQVDRATYAGALDVFEAHGCRATSRERKPLRYSMPAVHNPFGCSLSEMQRADLFNSHLIIEDDAYAELRFDGVVPPTLLKEARDRVFHVGSFSKTLSPGLRVGYVVPPPQWLKAIAAAKGERDMHANGVCQAIVEHYIHTERFDERLRELRAYYRARCEKLLSALPHLHGIRFWVPAGGFSVWIETQLRMSDEAFLKLAIENGVSFDPGCLFRAERSEYPWVAMRLSFSCVPEEQILAGVDRLSATLDRARAMSRRAA